MGTRIDDIKAGRAVAANLAALLVFFLCPPASAVSLTRTDIVSRANAWEAVEAWPPATDTFVFSSTVRFQSCFRTAAHGGYASLVDKPQFFNYENPPYPVEAYVYGGKDSEPTFVNRVKNQNNVPGGRNVAKGFEALSTMWLYENGFDPAAHLAGVDCSGFVCHILNISHINTTDLSRNSLELDSRAELKPGDMLIRPGRHVVFVLNVPQEGKVTTAESASPPGHVIIRSTRSLTDFGASYKPYTLFPIFSNFSPAEESFINDVTPKIQVTIKSSASIKGSEIVLKINDKVMPDLPTYPNAKEIQFSYTVPEAEKLSAGEHTITISAINERNLEDETSVRFNIADPLFFVGGRKLIFSVSAIENAENQGYPGFYHRALFTHSGRQSGVFG